MQDREQLIASLASDLKPQTQHWPILKVAMIWWVLSWGYVTLAILAMGSMRASAYHDISHSHHFQIESALGLIVSLLLAVAAWYSAIPGALSRKIFYATITLFSMWILFYVAGFYEPAIEPSMHGKREHCYYESFIYSIPPMLLACFLMAKRFPLKKNQSGLLIGLAAGIIPALFMQFACMYEPEHILTLHILPGIAAGLIGAALFPLIYRWASK